ncbi:MAG: terminase small subunit [Candidatus Saccharibacteria bacterium]|nr:terminase small subunit [Rhodoferax sp.]
MHKNQLTARQKLFCEHMVGAGRGSGALAARLAGFSAASSHVTACRLLKQPKIAATVRGLEEAVAREMGVSRQKVIAELVGAADLARELREPSSMISAFRNVAQICGYYRQEEVTPVMAGDGGEVLNRLNRLSDRELVDLIEAGGAA